MVETIKTYKLLQHYADVCIGPGELGEQEVVLLADHTSALAAAVQAERAKCIKEMVEPLMNFLQQDVYPATHTSRDLPFADSVQKVIALVEAKIHPQESQMVKETKT